LTDWRGFVNGEGSFYVVKDNTVHRFVIEHTDKIALDLVKNNMDLSAKVSKVTIRGNRKQTYSISASSKQDIKKVLDFIDAIKNRRFFIGSNQLQGYKLEQYNRFKDSFIKKS